jgi:hypothetical protein
VSRGLVKQGLRNVIQIKARFFALNDCSATYRIVRAKDFSPLRQKHAFIDFAFLMQQRVLTPCPKTLALRLYDPATQKPHEISISCGFFLFLSNIYVFYCSQHCSPISALL